MLPTDLLYGAHDPEEVEAGQLLEVLQAPGVGGQEGREEGRVRGHVLKALRHPAIGSMVSAQPLQGVQTP